MTPHPIDSALEKQGRTAMKAWKLYDVTFRDFPPVTYTAQSRSKAIYACFLSLSDVYDLKFKDFLKVVTATRRALPPWPDGYDYVRRNYGVLVQIGLRCTFQGEPSLVGKEGTVVYPNRTSAAHVYVAIDGEGEASIVHPLSIVLLKTDERGSAFLKAKQAQA